MKSEELFEIDRQINQIKRGLQQRHEKVVEWEMPILNVLKEKPAKDQYLSKKYSQSRLSHYLASQSNPKEAKRLLQLHNQNSRAKIRLFKNDLHQLHELIRKRNVIRLGKIQTNSLSHQQVRRQEIKNVIKKDFSKTTYENFEAMHKRHQHEHSALSTIKGQKLLQIYMEGKLRSNNNDQVLGYLKKQLGIGIQNTPFYSWLERSKSAEKILMKNKSKCSIGIKNTKPVFRFYDNMKKDVANKDQIYLLENKHLGLQFQERLKRIIKYHSNNIHSVEKAIV